MSQVDRAHRPLTAMLRNMVFASMRDPRSGAYIIQDVCETPETLDLARLQCAWRVVAGRNSALRTMVQIDAKQQPWQWVADTAELPCNESDWTGVADEDYKSRLASFLNEDRACGFDFAGSVPMRMHLFHMPGGASVLIWTSHHVLLDGRSYLIVWREWLAAYDALADDVDFRLPDAHSFTSYLDWLDRQDFAGAEQYWRQHLNGVSRTTGYVVDRLRDVDSPEHGTVARERAAFSPKATARIRDFTRRHDLTVGTLAQGAWALLLSRYGNTRDVVFGVTREGRRSGVPDVANIVGPLINTLPSRMIVEPSVQVLPWLRQIRKEMLVLREYEQMPLDKIREWHLLPAGSPPFDTLFVYEYESLGDALRKLGGAWTHRSVTALQSTDIPLTLSVVGSPVLHLNLIYDSRLFAKETIAGIAGHLQTLIENFIAEPDSLLGRVQMLTARERQWLIEERNQTDSADTAGLCAHQLFELQAELTPAAPAIDRAGTAISFEQLNAWSNQLAGFLREQGAGPGVFVGVCLPRSPDAVAAVLAVLKSSAAFVLVPPDLPMLRLAAMLNDVRPKFVISSAEHAGKLAGCVSVVLCLDELAAAVAQQSNRNLSCTTRPDCVAYATFTSGSTGTPKAVVHIHRSLTNHTRAASGVYGISSADRRLQFAAIGSDMFLSEVFTYLCSGAALVFCMDAAGNSIAEFLRLIDTYRITITGLPSSWWNGWAAAMESGALTIPPCLRAVIVGMERLNSAALASFRRVVGEKLRLFNAYGPTETGPTTTIYETGSSPWESESLVPIGKPIANMRVYVLDEYANPVPVGIPGELYIGGAGVGCSYLNAPDLTAAKFQRDPFSSDPADRLFRTGDRVWSLPDGNLVFLGRMDRQVKIRGFRVEPEEIEAVLAEHHRVRQCAVVAQGEDGHQMLAAWFTAAGVPPPAPEDLRLHLFRRLPDYMVPTTFTVLPAMPMTSSGKVDRQSLQLRAAPAQPQENWIEPATPTEKRLAEVWQQLLGVPRVSAAANFFEAGGDSLRATQLVMRIQREFGEDLPFGQFLRAPTIAQIALVLDHGMAVSPGQDMARGATLAYAHQGTRLPLFCITSHAHDLYVFRHLANHLDNSQPIFVLNTPLQEHEDLCSVEELAARVRRSIRDIRPEGPYILGGYCFGGIVAFETAQQLLAEGNEVPMLAFFDTPAPGYPRLLGSHQLARQVRALGRMLKRPADGPATGIAGTIQATAKMYVPQAIDSDIVQFIAQDQTVSSVVLEDPRLAWRDLCRGCFQVCRVPGDHVTWLQQPNAKVAAERLTEVLEKQNRITATNRALPHP